MEIGKKSYILFLSEVFPEDCLDDETVLKTLCVEEIPEEPDFSEVPEISEIPEIPDFSENEAETYYMESPQDYETLPDYFVDVESWPKTTNLLCWCCDTSFRGMPWIIPIGKVMKSETLTDNFTPETYGLVDHISPKVREYYAFQRLGCFCCEFCAQKYINRSGDPKIKNKWESGKLLLEVYKIITGRHTHYIPESEDKYMMAQYCGKKGISISEYRERNDSKRAITY
jgi:hypothetical protein